MLKQRVITGLVLALVAISGVYLLPSGMVAVCFAVVLMLAAWEWSRLTSQTSTMLRGLYVIMVTLSLLLIWFLRFTSLGNILLVVAMFLWFSIFFALFRYRPTGSDEPRHQNFLALLGPPVLGAAFLAIFGLHQLSPWWLLYALALTAIADIGAYFAGKNFGKEQLSPNLSPGKTREGVLGGMLSVLVLAILVCFFVSLSFFETLLFLILSVLMSVVSVVGDLFFSMLKRESGVKDSGNILPGHGGVLDRLDSHIAVLPLFYIGLGWILAAG